MPIKRNAPAVIVDDLPFDAPAGHLKWVRNERGEIAGCHYGCPCGCGAVHGAYFGNMPGHTHPWSWDGNTESPTINPSLGLNVSHRNEVGPDGRYHWHGFLRNGVFEEC
jgi:hypothetical protein